MAEIRLDHGQQGRSAAFTAVDDVSLEIADGEFLVLVGPSGCGKSTLLRMIAGLEEVTDGEIFIGERDVTDLAPRSRDVAMVFQTLRALPAHVGSPEHGLWAEGTPDPEAGDRQAGRRRRGAARALGAARPAAGAALRRSAPARRDGPGDRAPAAGVPARRAALEPRREAARRDARVARPAASAARRHDRLRDARPDRGDDPRAARRSHARTASFLQVDTPKQLYERPDESLHRGVHRLAGDEPRRRDGRPRPACDSDSSASRSPTGTLRPAGAGARRARHRPETFEDAAFAPGLPRISRPDRGARGARLRRPCLLPCRRRPDHGRDSRNCARLEACRTPEPSSRPGSTPETTAHVGQMLELAVDPRRFHFFDPETGARLTGSAAARARRRSVTKQRETRESVLELIEPLAVGAAIPSERQLGVDLGVSRLDRARRARRARARGLPRAPPRRRHVRRRAEGREGHRRQLVQRRHAGARADARRAARSTLGSCPQERASGACCTFRRRSRSSPSSACASPTASRWRSSCSTSAQSLVPGLTARDLEENSFYELLVDRYDLRSQAAPRPSSRRSRTTRNRPRSASRYIPRRCSSNASPAAIDRRRDRVHELDLPRRPLPARDRARRRRPTGAAARDRPSCRRDRTLIVKIGIDICLSRL